MNFEKIVGLDLKFLPPRLLLIKVRVMRVGRRRHVSLCQYLLFIRLRLARHVTVPLEQVLNAFPSEK